MKCCTKSIWHCALLSVWHDGVHTLNNSSPSTLAASESDGLPSPHEGDYTNLCKACKWFILHSTTKGFPFFFFFAADKTRIARQRETLTPAVILTFTVHMYSAATTADPSGAIKHVGIWDFIFLFFKSCPGKVGGCICWVCLCSHESYFKGNTRKWSTQHCG